MVIHDVRFSQRLLSPCRRTGQLHSSLRRLVRDMREGPGQMQRVGALLEKCGLRVVVVEDQISPFVMTVTIDRSMNIRHRPDESTGDSADRLWKWFNTWCCSHHLHPQRQECSVCLLVPSFTLPYSEYETVSKSDVSLANRA